MPICIQADLPAIEVLEGENIFVMQESRAITQDIRPLRIAILILMLTIIESESFLLRLLGNSPLQVEAELVVPSTHTCKHTSSTHLNKFYKTFQQIKRQRFDGMIITGAPVETLAFEAVDYWQEMCSILEWTKENVYSTMHICWAAQAGLFYHHGISKRRLPQKLCGIFQHRVTNPYHPLMRGFDDTFLAPHSSYSEVPAEEVVACKELICLADSELAGLHILAEQDGRRIYITGHQEYDRDTLAKEYFRDVNKGLDPAVPYNYFPGDDPTQTPPFTWRSNAHLLISNWLNYYVYQQTPFDFVHGGSAGHAPEKEG